MNDSCVFVPGCVLLICEEDKAGGDEKAPGFTVTIEISQPLMTVPSITLWVFIINVWPPGLSAFCMLTQGVCVSVGVLSAGRESATIFILV